MAMKVTIWVALVLAVTMVVAAESAGMDCGVVVQYLNPCFPYVTGRGPLGQCCAGVEGLYRKANSTPDRQAVCSCLKTLARTNVVNMNRAASLPKSCGLNIPYKISPATDCTRVR